MAQFREVHWACKPIPQSPRVVVDRKAFLLWVKFEFPSYFSTASILVYLSILWTSLAKRLDRIATTLTKQIIVKRTIILCIYCAIKSYICTLNWIFLSKEGFNWNRHWRMEVHNFLHFWSGQTAEQIRIHVWLVAAYGCGLFRSRKTLEALKDIGSPRISYLGERLQVPKVAFSCLHVRGECCKQGTRLSLQHMLGPSRVLLWIPTCRSSSFWETKYFRGVKVDHHVQGGDAGETAGVQDAFSWGCRRIRGSQVEFKW